MDFFIFLLASAGLTIILTKSRLFAPIRPKHYFFSCGMCVGAHIGWMMFLLFWFCGFHLFPNILVGAFIFMFPSSVISWILSNLGVWLENKAHEE